MSFKINPVEGTVAEIDVDLSVPTQHEREDTVVPVIKKAITDIIESLGGYLSVSANGNINSVSGETGDVVNIYITSLPNPNPQTTTPESAPVVQTGEPTPVTVEPAIEPSPVPMPEPSNLPHVTAAGIETQNPVAIEPATAAENQAEIAQDASSVEPAV